MQDTDFRGKEFHRLDKTAFFSQQKLKKTENR